MRRLGFLLVLALLPGWLTRARTPPDYGRQIEQVHSVAGVQRLLDTLCGLDCDLRIELDSLQEELAEKCALCQVAIGPSWVRTDLDGDEQPDLLLSSSDGSVAILNRPAARPLVLRVSRRGHHHWCRVVAAGRQAGQPVIRGEDIEYMSQTRKAQGQQPRRWRFTLMYQLGSFVDYAARPRWLPHRVQLTFSNGGPPPSRWVHDIDLNLKTGWATSTAGLRPDSTGRIGWRYQLSTGLLDTLRQHLRYLRLSSLARQYDKNANDTGFERLELRYRFRWPKKIEDTGRMGPHTLQVVNDLLLAAYEGETRRHPTRP